MGGMSDDARHTERAGRELAGGCAAVLGSNLCAAVLHGSLTLGDFEPGRSDIDLLLVTGPGGLTQTGRDRVVDVVRRAQLGAARAVDLLAVTSCTANAPSRAPASELQVARYPHELDVEGANPANEDVAVELSMARAGGRSVVGPPVAEVIGDVPAEWVQDRGLFWLRRWLTLTDDAEHAELMVLTACRIWRFAIEGTYCSKPQAGSWALERDPSLIGVTQALRQRRGDTSSEISADHVEHVLRTVLDNVTARDHSADRGHR